MIKASLEEKDIKYTEEDIINDLSIFFIAGHDTTANILTTTFYFLAKHPEIQEKARTEINTLLNYEKRTPTIKELNQMTYIDCIIKESMRIFSTVTQLKRYCINKEELSNHLTIPKNTSITIPLWTIHHDEKVFPDPYTFQPDRFKDPNNEQNKQWLPFGGGTRMCKSKKSISIKNTNPIIGLGKRFSLLEQRIILTKLIQTFTIHQRKTSKNLDTVKLSPWGIVYLNDVYLDFSTII